MSAAMSGQAHMARPPKTCPSGPPEPGSAILGFVVAPGQVAYLTPAIPVTPELIESLHADEIPIENRVRFSCECREHQCIQWTVGASAGGRCGLVDRAVEAFAIAKDLDDLPACGIRATCRWFAQHKRKACAACPEIVRKPAGAD